jgi:allophanate hydrolase subunit 2
MGPQDDHFTEEGIETFLSSEYAVSIEADRTGCRLQGPVVRHKDGADIISDGIPLGAVQVPGSGLPIVLLAGRQTAGGYPKIATVASVDVSRLGQAKPGDRASFRCIPVAEAARLLIEYRNRLATIESLLGQGHRKQLPPLR